MIPNPTMNHDDDGNLRWLAFRYVLDELDEANRSRFEARLEDDPGACEAVAEAVELIGACVSVREDSRRSLRRRPVRKRAVVGLVAVAAAAGIMLASSQMEFGSSSGREETIALELAWSGLHRGTLSDPDEPERAPWSADPITDISLDDIEHEIEIESSPPRWLIAAVELADDFREPESRPLEN